MYGSYIPLQSLVMLRFLDCEIKTTKGQKQKQAIEDYKKAEKEFWEGMGQRQKNIDRHTPWFIRILSNIQKK